MPATGSDPNWWQVVDVQLIARFFLRAALGDHHKRDRLRLWALLLGTAPACRSAQQTVAAQLTTRYADLKATCLAIEPAAGPLDLACLPWPPGTAESSSASVSVAELETMEAAVVSSVGLTAHLAVRMFLLNQKMRPGELGPTDFPEVAAEAVAEQFLQLSDRESDNFWLLTSFLQLLQAHTEAG